MWHTLPADLLVHLGSFLPHRDVRCLQATCVRWARTWASKGFVFPHPIVQQIDVCRQINCINRQGVHERIEPFLSYAPEERPFAVGYQLLKFMVLWIPVKALSSLLRHTMLGPRCTTLETSLVFWCNCRRYVFPVAAIRHVCCPRGTSPGWRTMKESCADNVYVWCFLIVMTSIPTSIIFFTLLGTLVLPVLFVKVLYTILMA
jgi:hypothetical protein